MSEKNKKKKTADEKKIAKEERKLKKEQEKLKKKLEKEQKKAQKKSASKKAKRTIEHKLKRVDVSQIIPFDFDSEEMKFRDTEGKYIMMVRIVGTNLFGFKDEDKLAYINAFKHIFSRSIGEGQIYSFQIGADVDKYVKDYQFFIDNLDLSVPQNRIKHDILRQAQTRLKYVSATKNLVDREFLIILKDKDIRRLEARCREVTSALYSYQSTYILDFVDTYNVLFNYYHPVNSKLFFEAKKDMTNSGVMDYLYPTRIGTVEQGFRQSIELDGIFCRVKYISDYKKQPVFALMSYLATAGDLDFSMHFMPAESDVITKEIDKDLKAEQRNLEKATEASQQMAAQVAIQQKAAMQEKMIADGDVPYYFSVFVRIKGNTLQEVNNIAIELDKAFINEGCRFRDGVFEPFEMFNYCAPICKSVEDRFYKATTTETLAFMYPFIFEALYDSVPLVSNENISTPPVYIGNTLQTNGVVFYDSFTRQGTRSNYNEFIVGNSGMGKTTFIMWLIYSRYALGYKQYIIDVEGKELNKLTHYLGGENVDCSNGEKGRINPLQIRFNIPDNDDGDKDKKTPLTEIFPLSAHLRFLRSFFNTYKGDSSEIGILHDNIIEKALRDVYEDIGITFKTNAQYIVDNYSNEQYPIMMDIYNKIGDYLHKEQENEIPDMVEIERLKVCRAFIEPLAVGTDSDLFNGVTNIDLSNPLINFNISALQDNTGSRVLMTQYFNILSYIWTDILSDGNEYRKQLYADEFSVIMDKRCLDIMMYFQSIIKRIRKYYGGFTSATQQISDVLKESVREQGEAIIENSVYKFFFGLGAEGIQFLNGNSLIPDAEKEFVQFASIGECYAKIGTSTSMRIKIIIDEDVFEVFRAMKD